MDLCVSHDVEQTLKNAHPDLTVEKFDELVSTINYMAEDGIHHLPVAEHDKKFFESEAVTSLIKQNTVGFEYRDGEVHITGDEIPQPECAIDNEDFEEIEE